MKSLQTIVTSVEWQPMRDDVDKFCQDASEKFLDRRALIFIEEAIAHYNARFGVRETQNYLAYMIDYLEEFKTGNDDV